jgi:hypothetical protein
MIIRNTWLWYEGTCVLYVLYYKPLLCEVEILECSVREAKVTFMRQECSVRLYVSLECLVLCLNTFVFMYNRVSSLPFSAPFAFSCPVTFRTTYCSLSPSHPTHIFVSIQQNAYWETNSHSACQEIRDFFLFSTLSNSFLSVYLYVSTSVCLSFYPAIHPQPSFLLFHHVL